MREFQEKRRRWPFEQPNDPHLVPYKRFRRRIIQRNVAEGPAASTPVTAGWRCEHNFDFDPICQRLELDSPPTPQKVPKSLSHEAVGGGLCVPRSSSCTIAATENATEQAWFWTTAVQEDGNLQPAGSDARKPDLRPFGVLNQTSESLQGKPCVELAAPSLVNDYYTNLLDCSSHGMVALALGSSVYIWNSETRALVGRLNPTPRPPGGLHCRSVSCLCWSRDGRALCIATRRGEVQLWDVERTQNIRRMVSHLSVVGALSWKQHLLSSGSVLGHIHHLDPRGAEPLVGAAVQAEGICSMEWSPGDDRLASGSTGGHLHIWDKNITGIKTSHQPLTTIKQPSAVKAMGWCPWRSNVIATGGGWKDGHLRVWDTESRSCVSSVNTNSQICSLRWENKRRRLMTGHATPHHQITCWDWTLRHISPLHRLTGHSQRVLHLAINPDNTQIFSAGADQRLHVWEL